MITHYALSQKRKNSITKEQYRRAIEFMKTVGAPVGKLPLESWTDYIARVTKSPDVQP